MDPGLDRQYLAGDGNRAASRVRSSSSEVSTYALAQSATDTT